MTFQGTVTDPGAVLYLWELMVWLSVGQYKGESAPGYTSPKPPKIKPLKGK